jgi:PQQ-dependent catabolism-associated CXXCW motif protein
MLGFELDSWSSHCFSALMAVGRQVPAAITICRGITVTFPNPPVIEWISIGAPPATLAGGTVLDTAGVQETRRLPGTILIDVLPEQKRPDNLPANTLWIPKARFNIPGSVWLPDVGRGALSDSMDAYYRSNLERLTDADRSRTIIIYCLAECWMSWNAAKRAIEYGYSSVYWYPGGTDDWTAAGLPTEESQSVPLDNAPTTTN